MTSAQATHPLTRGPGQVAPIEDRPALGVFLHRPETIARRTAAQWLQRMSRIDFAARSSALARLVTIHERTGVGRRLDLVAGDLRELADELDQVPQRHTGGWPLRSVS